MRTKTALLILATTLFGGEAKAQKIHALIVGDTYGTLGEGARRNLLNMGTFIKSAQSAGEIPVSVEEIKDNRFRCRSISDALQQLKQKAGPSDAVVFYYAGHGFRLSSTPTKFPIFDCNPAPGEPNLGLSDVVDRLSKGGRPRLLIALADTCNVEIQLSATFGMRAPKIVPKNLKEGVQQLFMNHSGTLIMSAAQPKEFAWYRISGPTDLLGGFFTNQLLQKINENIEAKASNVVWEDISKRASTPIIVPTSEGRKIQTPQYESNLVVSAKSN